MATIGDVLAQLVRSAPGLSDDNRAEYLAAVEAAYPAPAAATALAQAEADVAAAQAELTQAAPVA